MYNYTLTTYKHNARIVSARKHHELQSIRGTFVTSENGFSNLKENVLKNFFWRILTKILFLRVRRLFLLKSFVTFGLDFD